MIPIFDIHYIFQNDRLLFGDKDVDGYVKRQKIYSFFAVLLFSGFVLYDTHKIFTDAHKVVAGCESLNQLDCADYPVASLGIFLDAVNLFNNLSLLQ